MNEVITIDKDYVKEIVEEYKRAIDVLGLADIIPLEEHRAKIKRIQKMENLFEGRSTVVLQFV